MHRVLHEELYNISEPRVHKQEKPNWILSLSIPELAEFTVTEDWRVVGSL